MIILSIAVVKKLEPTTNTKFKPNQVELIVLSISFL